jgi:integrase
LSNDEFGLLLAAAGKSTEVVHGLAGEDRRVLYLVAAATGLRVRELASLRPSSFHLDGETAYVVCNASYAKNGTQAYQPLPPALVPVLRAYLTQRPGDEPVFPGYWRQRASELLQADLAAAGVPYVVDGEYADFHSLRCLFVTSLCRAGVPAHTAQTLARHSTPVLTLGTYAKATNAEAARAVASLALPLASEDSEGQNGESKKAG